MALTKLQDVEGLTKDVDSLVQKLERLRTLYEQYFLGLERVEPQKLRSEVVGLVRKHAGGTIQNARLKFRYQQAVARYNTYTTYWDRVLREIEDGNYDRDVFKAKIHQAQHKVQSKRKLKSPDPFEDLFGRYIKAKHDCKEPTKGLSLEQFRKALQSQIETIKKKTSCADVRVDVITEAGKVKIRAVPVVPKATNLSRPSLK